MACASDRIVTGLQDAPISASAHSRTAGAFFPSNTIRDYILGSFAEQFNT
jgi:hypothetical protein